LGFDVRQTLTAGLDKCVKTKIKGKEKKKAPHGLYRCSQYSTIAHFQVLILQRCSFHPNRRED
jgi:hypothetical protein